MNGPSELSGKHLVLGLTGGIAAYKAADLLRKLVEAGHDVRVIMTDAATRFITPVTMQALTGRPVFVDAWDARAPGNMAHIDLSREADAIVIVPASADFVAKLAQGACDDLLSTLCLARDCPLLIAPAMNKQMWAHPATQRNLRTVRGDGAIVFDVGSGDQACGEVGSGRMLEPDELVDEVIAFFQPKPLVGRRVVVTAGPTREPIDPVRSITNHSSGKMGYAIARAAREAGAVVTLVSGPTALKTPRGVERIDIETARELHAVALALAAACDCFVAVAAVADWHVTNPSTTKIKKHEAAGSDAADGLALAFGKNPDVLADVAALPAAPLCVGFAAETDDLDANAEAKRRRKGVAMIVGNRAQDAFGRDDNTLTLYDARGRTSLGHADKLTLARRLVAEIATRLAADRDAGPATPQAPALAVAGATR